MVVVGPGGVERAEFVGSGSFFSLWGFVMVAGRGRRLLLVVLVLSLVTAEVVGSGEPSLAAPPADLVPRVPDEPVRVGADGRPVPPQNPAAGRSPKV